MKIDVGPDGYVPAAEDLGPLLGVAPADIPHLMRSGAISGVFERGEGEHAGSFRLTFRHKSERAQLTCTRDGRVLSRTRGTVKPGK